MHQLKGRVESLALASPGIPAFLFLTIHNLNHVSVLSCYFCSSWLGLCASLCVLPLAFTLPYTGVDLSTYVILSFYIFLFFLPIVFFSRPLDRQKNFFLPPLGSCLPFLFLLYPFHLPDLLQPACFSACLLLLRVSLCPCGTACVSLSV